MGPADGATALFVWRPKWQTFGPVCHLLLRTDASTSRSFSHCRGCHQISSQPTRVHHEIAGVTFRPRVPRHGAFQSSCDSDDRPCRHSFVAMQNNKMGMQKVLGYYLLGSVMMFDLSILLVCFISGLFTVGERGSTPKDDDVRTKKWFK